MFTCVSLAIVGVFALLLLKSSGLLDNKKRLAVSVVMIAAAMLVRGALFYYRSDDYIDFLAKWVAFFRENGGFAALGRYPGNYNPPYMYLLALFSYFGISDLQLIKLFSVLFDVLLAWACMMTASLFTGRKPRLLACFFAVLFLPTAVINSAYWGQCDSIYVFFGVWSIYLALSGKPAASMFAIAASLAFKLQAVFIMPVFFILLLAKKIKPRHLFIFPAAYLLYMLPSVIAGMPLLKALTMYVSQAQTVGSALNYNAPSLTSMMYGVTDAAAVSDKLIAAAFAFVAAVYVYAIFRRKIIDGKAVLAFAVLLAIAVPYLLPHMHDRYFYPAELLALTAVFVSPELLPMPVLTELASLHCYFAYFSRHYLVQPRLGGFAVAISLIIALIYALICCRGKKINNFEFSS